MEQEYNINELKKETGLTQKNIAQFFNMTYGAFANSSAKKRYETALCEFYSFLREREKQDTTDVSDRRELLLSFLEFRDEVYWGENEHTENEEIVDLWILKENYSQ